MASAKSLARLDAAAWTLIYGGLVVLIIGLTLRTQNQPVLGWTMVGGGAAAALAGAGLIALRSRLREPGASSPNPRKGTP